MPTAMQSMNTTHIKNLMNPTILSRSTMAKPIEDTVHTTKTIHTNSVIILAWHYVKQSLSLVDNQRKFKQLSSA